MDLQFIINGLISGLLYSLLAVGFALVYYTTGVLHIAAAALFITAGYSFWFLSERLGFNWYASLSVSTAIVVVLSILSEVILYRPLQKKKKSGVVTLVASIGVACILTNLIILFFGNEIKVVTISVSSFSVGKVLVTGAQLFQLTIGVVSMALFFILLHFSEIGLSIKALGSDSVLFEILGYNVGRTRIIVFILSGVFISIAGILTTYDVGLDPNMGMGILLNSMAAMIIGGIGKFENCLTGGIILGLVQSSVGYFLHQNWQEPITFIILIIFLVLRPQGISGEKHRVI